jgi:hypothetical protein
MFRTMYVHHQELKTFLTEAASCLRCCLSIASVALVVGFSLVSVLRVLFRFVLLVLFRGVLESFLTTVHSFNKRFKETVFHVF